MATGTAKDDFFELIKDNKRIIFKICNAYCANKDDREDLAQEIIYQLWKSGKDFSLDFKFSTWMYRVALNVAISFYRKQKRKSAEIPFTGAVNELEDKYDESTMAEENSSLLQRFINELKELDRALIILYLEEKTYKEIAEIVGITETNVATKISRIKEKLKQRFSQFQQYRHGG